MKSLDIRSAIHNLKAQLGHPMAATANRTGPPDVNDAPQSTEDLSALPVAARRPKHRSTYIPLVAQAASKVRR